MVNKLTNLRRINLIRLLKLERFERSVIYAATIIIFVLLNLLVSSVSLRLDLSQGKAYTLSPATKKILKSLDDVINIKFFVSSDLPTQLLPVKTDVIDLLTEYEKANRGKIIIKILDPKKDNNALNQAKESGINELQFSQLENDKYQVLTSYFGIAVYFANKIEIIPRVTDLENLEYNLTAAIYKLTKKETDKIAFIGIQPPSYSNSNNLQTLKKVLEQQYSIDNIDVSSESAIKNIEPVYKTAMIFDDDKKKYNDQEINVVKKYFDGGGKLVFFTDGVWIDENFITSEAKHNLFSLFSSWGIKLDRNLILSTSAELVNFGNESVQFLTPYPFWLKTNNFNNKLGYFVNVQQLTFPWASSLTMNKKAGLTYEEMIKTISRSWQQKDNFNLDPQNITEPQSKDLKQFLIAASVKNNKGGQAIVIPSSRFVYDSYLSRTSDNLEFVLNMINNLASQGALSGIRSRMVFYYPLPDLLNNQKEILKYGNILLLPLIFTAYGAIKNN